MRRHGCLSPLETVVTLGTAPSVIARPPVRSSNARSALSQRGRGVERFLDDPDDQLELDRPDRLAAAVQLPDQPGRSLVVDIAARLGAVDDGVGDRLDEEVVPFGPGGPGRPVKLEDR
ncbi:MAG TPA: hypothetical protein VEW26_09580, partial [Allosphingosinicella sp.]|nr:hypothetical protein [Allosphingosinicella sp.]